MRTSTEKKGKRRPSAPSQGLSVRILPWSSWNLSPWTEETLTAKEPLTFFFWGGHCKPYTSYIIIPYYTSTSGKKKYDDMCICNPIKKSFAKLPSLLQTPNLPFKSPSDPGQLRRRKSKITGEAKIATERLKAQRHGSGRWKTLKTWATLDGVLIHANWREFFIFYVFVVTV